MTILTKRSGFNLNPIAGDSGEADYAYIDHAFCGGLNPVGVQWSTTTKPYQQCLNQTTAWPNDQTARTQEFGSAFLIPDPANFAGPYVLTWTGDLDVRLENVGWTFSSALSTGVDFYNGVDGFRNNHALGSTAYAVISVSTAFSSPPDLRPLIIFTRYLTDPGGSSNYGSYVKFYRLADEARLQSGKMFRLPWLHQMADTNQGHIRFLNWIEWTNPICRFEHLGDPSKGGFGQWTMSPPYNDSSGSNFLKVDAISSGPITTATSMVHGEIATFRIGQNLTNPGVFDITSISNANPGHVVTSSPHGFTVGDQIIMSMGNSSASMSGLQNYPVQVSCTNFSASAFDICVIGTSTSKVDTSTFSGYLGGGYACEYVTLQVGASLGRAAYPVSLKQQAASPVGSVGHWGGGFSTAWVAGGGLSFYFDKNLSAITDGTGTWINGTWFVDFDACGGAKDRAQSAADTGRPIEHIVQFTNEVNELSLSQGVTCPSACWITLPGRGLINSTAFSTFDPDYSSGSNMPVNITNTVMNGARGFNGLQFGAPFIWELGNEPWNLGSYPEVWFRTVGYQRYGQNGGTGSVIDYYPLRTAISAQNTQAAFPTTSWSSRIAYMMGVWVNAGYYSSGAGFNPSQNFQIINGSCNYNNDPVNTWHTAPISFHDGFHVAPYTGPTGAYLGSTAQFGTDSVNWNTGVSSAQHQAQLNFANACIPNDFGISVGLNFYLAPTGSSGVMAEYSQACSSLSAQYGRQIVCGCYEGGAEWGTAQGSNWFVTLSSGDQNFMMANYDSSEWANVQLSFFNQCSSLPGLVAPSVLLPMTRAPNFGPSKDQRWAYAWPDAYRGGVEGPNLALNPTWAGMGARNVALCGGGSITLPSGGGVQSLGFKYGVFKTRPVKIPHA